MVDDFGDAVFVGHYSGLLVWPDDVIYLGPVVPQAPDCYVDRKEGIKERLKSVQVFNESEANCNTCAHLTRLPFKKSSSGLMPGKCTNKDADFSVHPYPPDAGGVMRFAPEDWQGMPCWKLRRTATKS